MALRDGDVITLQATDDDGGAAGFLALDVKGLCGSAADHLVTMPMVALDNGDLIPPASMESHSLFRIETDRKRGGGSGDILYGQRFMLVHLATDLAMCATSDEQAVLQPIS
jgi:hypothetical protein